jgi:hypothetical protein
VSFGGVPSPPPRFGRAAAGTSDSGIFNHLELQITLSQQLFDGSELHMRDAPLRVLPAQRKYSLKMTRCCYEAIEGDLRGML